MMKFYFALSFAAFTSIALARVLPVWNPAVQFGLVANAPGNLNLHQREVSINQDGYLEVGNTTDAAFVGHFSRTNPGTIVEFNNDRESKAIGLDHNNNLQIVPFSSNSTRFSVSHNILLFDKRSRFHAVRNSTSEPFKLTFGLDHNSTVVNLRVVPKFNKT